MEFRNCMDLELELELEVELAAAAAAAASGRPSGYVLSSVLLPGTGIEL